MCSENSRSHSRMHYCGFSGPVVCVPLRALCGSAYSTVQYCIVRQCVHYSTVLYCAAVRTVQYSTAGSKMQLSGRQFSSRLVTAGCHVNGTVTTSNECYIQGENNR
jgi:hypothetical protein